MGKNVVEDINPLYGRTRNFPSVPEGLARSIPTSCSTTIVCHICGGAYDGLQYDAAHGAFFHRRENDCAKHTRLSRRGA